MFSATFSDEIKKLSEAFLNNPLLIEVARSNATNENVTQNVYLVDQDNKHGLLSKLLTENTTKQVIVFTKTKLTASRLARQLVREGIAADAIHGDGQHLMGLSGEGPEAHATGAEAAADALHALHLVQGKGRGGGLELQQVAQGGHRPVLEQCLVGGEVVVARARLNGGMEGLGHLGAVEVVLAAGAVLHEAHELELGAIELGEGLGVEAQGLAGEIGRAHV